MSYNILIGGAAGQGMDTFASIFSKVLQRNGFKLFTLQDYMSRVRGGHNFFQIRFDKSQVKSHSEQLDGIIAFNQETLDLHLERLKDNGFVIADADITSSDKRLITVSAQDIAKEIGNKRVFTSVFLGTLLKLFDISSDCLKDILEEKFSEEIVKANIKAVKEGSKLAENKYEIKTPKKEKQMLINGNEAIALGALASDLRFYSAYPMTPSTSIMSYLTKKGQKAKIVTEQAEDEIAAINMALGASYAGVRAMTGTSGGGFSLMVEALGFAGISEIPLVIAVIQRPGPATGLPTRTEQGDLKFVINASQGEFPRMVIALRSPEDAFYQTIRAFNIADKYQISVILLGDQYLADATQNTAPFVLEKDRINRYFADAKDYNDGKEYKRYELTKTGISPRLAPGMVKGTAVNTDSDEHDEYGNITESAKVRIEQLEKRQNKLTKLQSEDLQEPTLLGDENAKNLIICWGSMYSQVSEAIDILQKDHKGEYKALIFGDIWPFPQEKLLKMAKDAKQIINVEQNYTAQFASIVREVTGIKVDKNILRYDGRPISPMEIVEKVTEVQ